MEQLLSAITGSSSESGHQKKISKFTNSVTGINGAGDGSNNCDSSTAVEVIKQTSNGSGSATIFNGGLALSQSAPQLQNQQQHLTSKAISPTNGINNNKIPFDILDDLASRFIINTPVDERNNLIRICFQIELAHWFYLDFYCSNEDPLNTKKLLQCGIKQFAVHLFHHIPFLRIHLSDIDKILEDWKEYKLSVPTYGAILVTEDLNNVLLVQSYWAKSSWGFPKGKINEHEDPAHCATREVYEETGFDITDLIDPKEYIEAVLNYQYTRLYLIRNVPYDTKFSPRTRKEIKSCEWFSIDALPTSKIEGGQCKTQLGINANSFFMIMPFMKRLKKWIHDNRSGIEHKFSLSPITTINNNGFISSSGSSSTTKKSFTDTSNQSAFKATNNNNNNNIDNNNNNTNTTNNNNSNSNNNASKMRPRHKSMGDIDGVNLNNLGNITGMKTSTPKNQCYFNDNQISPNSKRMTSGNLSQNQSHIKRQLFNCSSIDSTMTATNRNLIENEKKIAAKSSIKMNPQNANQNQRSRTKSLSGNNNLPGNNNSSTNNKVQRKISSDSTGENGITSSMTPSVDIGQNLTNTKHYSANLINSNINGFNIKTKQLNCIQEQVNIKDFENLIQITNIKNIQQNSDIKFNPNFESWTNFSFTKNFITNVF